MNPLCIRTTGLLSLLLEFPDAYDGHSNRTVQIKIIIQAKLIFIRQVGGMEYLRFSCQATQRSYNILSRIDSTICQLSSIFIGLGWAGQANEISANETSYLAAPHRLQKNVAHR